VLNTVYTGYLLQKLLIAHRYTDTQSRADCSTGPLKWLVITPCLKNVTTLSCYNFDLHKSILIGFGRNVNEKVSNKDVSFSPPHLTNASALSRITGNPEIASFHLTKNTKNIKIYYLVTAEPLFTVKTIDGMH